MMVLKENQMREKVLQGYRWEISVMIKYNLKIWNGRKNKLSRDQKSKIAPTFHVFHGMVDLIQDVLLLFSQVS